MSFRVPIPFRCGEGNTDSCASGKHGEDAAESKTLACWRHSKRENREIPSVPCTAPEGNLQGRSANLSEGTADMNADGKSDDFVVLSTRTNKAATAVAESVEERKSPKGSVVELSSTYRTPSRITRHKNGTTTTTGSDVQHRDRLT